MEPVSEQGLLLRLMNDLFNEPLSLKDLKGFPGVVTRTASLQDEGSEVHCKVQMLEAGAMYMHHIVGGLQ